MEFKTDLYNHQIAAVEKLRQIKVGALYMEQGTGKTRTGLELVNIRLKAGKINKVLWLCPCSVKENLRRDLLKHVDDISMIEICGIETLSSSIRENSRLLNMVRSLDVYLIVDESNLVKNPQALRTKNIIRLSENCKYKLILNGTPISRCEADLYSQWHILDYRILGYKSFWSFAANHLEYDDNGQIRRALNTDYLVRKISPYTYQVKKSECLDLPPKTYQLEYFYITNEQDDHYSEVADQLMFEVDEMKPETIYRLFTGLQDITSGFKVNIGKHLTTTPFFSNPIDNPRMQKLLQVVDGITKKSIIFCKYTQEINDVVNVLNDKYGTGTAVPFNGDLNMKKRLINLDSFTGSSQFLVANKTCAGYGLNLQFCSYVIYYNNDWDYATRAQSEDRVHRIGQDNNVTIIDICASGTLDERIVDCLLRKERLVDSFKHEIDKNKDNKESWVDMFVYRKRVDGKMKRRGVKSIDLSTLENLKEGE